MQPAEYNLLDTLNRNMIPMVSNSCNLLNATCWIRLIKLSYQWMDRYTCAVILHELYHTSEPELDRLLYTRSHII